MSETLLGTITSTFTKLIDTLLSLCDPQSEIERVFLLKIVDYCFRRQDRFSLRFIIDAAAEGDINIGFPDNVGRLLGISITQFELGSTIEIYPQFNIVSNDEDRRLFDKSYRLDFAFFVYGPNGALRKYCVECDGFNYHRTVEQIKGDNTRSRQLTVKDFRTIRYLGTEIFRMEDSDIGRLLMSFYLADQLSSNE
jgi:hypothetical protein